MSIKMDNINIFDDLKKHHNHSLNQQHPFLICHFTVHYNYDYIGGKCLRWCPATLISHHFTPTKDVDTGKAKSAAYWLVHGSLCVRFVMNA